MSSGGTPDEGDLNELGSQVHSDIAQRLSDFGEGYLLTKYVAMAEVIGQDGDRAVVTLTSADMRTWDSLGLLQMGVQFEQAGLVREGDS